MTNASRFRSRARGCLMGVAVGDAMGMSVEGMPPQAIRRATDGSGVVGFLPRIGPDIIPTQGLAAGETTDDWQLTRAVARSLIRTKGEFDLRDCAEEHVRELGTHHIGWGNTTTQAIRDIRDGVRDPLNDPLPPTEPNTGCGNGVMMKVAPLAIVHACRRSPLHMLWRDVRRLGMLTHQDIRASITAYAVAYGMWRCLLDGTVPAGTALLEDIRERVVMIDDAEGLSEERVSERIDLIGPALHDSMTLRLIKGYMRFHAMYTVTITLGTFMRHPNDFRAGVLEIVNQGGDADSNASILGALIGSVVGIEGIPHEWQAFNPQFDHAIALADELIEACR